MASLTVRNLRKNFGNVEVLKGVDIEAQTGEFIALVGPSGCGKSTLLAMIAGLETVTSGEIWIGDRIVNSVAPKDRDIAMVFQSYALYPTMSVRENMQFGMESRGIPKDQQKAAIERVAALLQIEHLLGRKPGQLSGGQRQRVAMGRALVRDPALFLFDEPLSNLDAKLRVDMRTEIKKLHQRVGTSVSVRRGTKSPRGGRGPPCRNEFGAAGADRSGVGSVGCACRACCGSCGWAKPGSLPCTAGGSAGRAGAATLSASNSFRGLRSPNLEPASARADGSSGSGGSTPGSGAAMAAGAGGGMENRSATEAATAAASGSSPGAVAGGIGPSSSRSPRSLLMRLAISSSSSRD